jgi:para-nitrobenzyl esterase
MSSAIRRNHLRKLFPAAFILTQLLVLVPALAGQQVVQIDTGKLRGVAADGVVAYKGIPYAAPPVGDLRWRAPQPAAAWQGVRSAAEYGHDCMQLPFPSDAAPLGTEPAEDCLVINVWLPEHPASKHIPVMVWIYGGGFVNGGSSPSVYDGSTFAKGGVAFVSFNYRLGRFGFFAHPALTQETPQGPLGNYAYMDQIAALKWVQRNIAAFGGDPKTVTIFGESAGGGSVHALLTSPVTAGLFERAIIESGGGRGGMGRATTRLHDAAGSKPSAESIGVAFAASKGIQADDPAALEKLRALPASAIVDGMNMASMREGATTYPGPMIDGQIVTEDADAAYLAGHQHHVPVIIGANSMDIGFQTGTFMLEPARFIAQTLSVVNQPVWEYRFSYVAQSLQAKMPGAPHATEIPFVFDTVKARYGTDLTPADEHIAQQTNQYWVNFAKTGDPNGAGLPQWPAYHAANDEIMDFTETGLKPGPDPLKAKLDAAIPHAAAPPATPASPTQK